MQVKFIIPESVADDAKRAVARDNSRLLAMAAGKPGSPYKRDSKGNLHNAQTGKFCSVK